jgi:23S rRNA pseudouridine2605 synthase
MEERLQKYMANCGVASRRKCEEIIMAGRVKVNDEIIKELGFKVNSEIDVVKVDHKVIRKISKQIYIALNKPVGYISTVTDDRNRATIIDLINIKDRIYPIGRLDYDTSGLILLTNDGEVYNRIIHPREEVNKTYIAVIKGRITPESAKKFGEGIDIGDYITAPGKIKIIKAEKDKSEVEITIHEGKNRQVRRMCDAVGHPVTSLKRVSVGKIKLDSLELGKWRFLKEEEIDYLRNL